MPGDVGGTRARGTAARIGLGVAIVLGASLVVAWFWNRFWWAPDDGVYAYKAWRLLHGANLHLDLQTAAPGYAHYINAAAMAVFGERLASLRIPLALLTVLGAGLTYVTFLRNGLSRAALAALAVLSFSYIQFLNPSSSWYIQSLILIMLPVLLLMRAGPGRLVMVGVLLGTMLLLRHPTAVFVGTSVLVYLLLEHSGDGGSGRSWVARVSLGLLATLIGFYLLSATGPTGLLLMGIWPMLILAAAIPRVDLEDRRALGLLACLGLGALAAASPLIVSLTLQGAWGAFFQDVVFAAARFSGLPMLDAMSHLDLLGASVGAIASRDPVAVANGILWCILLAAPALAGMLALRCIRNGERGPALLTTVVASFHGLVAVHYQIPIYLLYTTGLCLLAITIAAGPGLYRTWRFLLPVLCGIALVWQAGQPLDRGIEGIARGERLERTEWLGGRVGLHVSPRDAAVYGEVVAEVRRWSEPDETVLSLHMSPEIYFLAERLPPVGWTSSLMGMRGEGAFERELGRIRSDPPAVVLIRDVPKYRTEEAERLLQALMPDYRCLERVGPFEILLRRREGEPASRCG